MVSTFVNIINMKLNCMIVSVILVLIIGNDISDYPKNSLELGDHIREKPIKCNECRCHTGKKPCRYDSCGKNFIDERGTYSDLFDISNEFTTFSNIDMCQNLNSYLNKFLNVKVIDSNKFNSSFGQDDPLFSLKNEYSKSHKNHSKSILFQDLELENINKRYNDIS